MDEECFVKGLVFTVKSDKTETKAFESQHLKESCMNKRPFMLNMGKLLCQIMSTDLTVQLFISTIDSHYAYKQMKLSEETSQQRLSAIPEAKHNDCYLLKKSRSSIKVRTTKEYRTIAVTFRSSSVSTEMSTEIIGKEWMT